MSYLYLEYSDRVEKFDLSKNYGIDPLLQLGNKPLHKLVNLKEITETYHFLLEFLPLELWIKIFKQIYNDNLIDYRSTIKSEVVYNIHRLFKTRDHNEHYRDFEISIRASPNLYKYCRRLHEYKKGDVKEFFDYSVYISHHSLDIINALSDFLPIFTKCRSILDGNYSVDKWSLLINADVTNDFTFSAGYDSDIIMKNLLSQRLEKIRTFKTKEYNLSMSKNVIDNFYSNINRIRTTCRLPIN